MEPLSKLSPVNPYVGEGSQLLVLSQADGGSGVGEGARPAVSLCVRPGASSE